MWGYHRLPLCVLGHTPGPIATITHGRKGNMPRRLGDYAKLQYDGPVGHVSDILDRDVTIESASVVQGRFGKYVMMEVVGEGGEVMPIRSTGMIIVDAIERAIEGNAFPVQARFTKDGDTYRIE